MFERRWPEGTFVPAAEIASWIARLAATRAQADDAVVEDGQDGDRAVREGPVGDTRVEEGRKGHAERIARIRMRGEARAALAAAQPREVAASPTAERARCQARGVPARDAGR